MNSSSAQSIANLFLSTIVPVAKRKCGQNWLIELKRRYPVPTPPLKISLGLSEESAKQIISLGKEAADYFEGIVWIKLSRTNSNIK